MGPAALKLAMKKLNNCFVGLLMIAVALTCTLTLTSCGDDDKNEPDNTGASSARIIGVWKSVEYNEKIGGYDICKFDEDNIVTMYEISLVDDKIIAYQGYYTYDADNRFLIIHWSHYDVELGKVDMLTNTELVTSWIDADISERYSRPYYYSKAKDLEICREYADRDYTVDGTYRYVRTTEDALPKNVEIIPFGL